MKIKNLSLLIVISFCLCGCSFTEEKVVNETKTEDIIIPIERTYDEIKNYRISWNQIFDVSENDYYVYFYSETCNHCENLKDFIIEKALDRKDIYFVLGSNKDNIQNDINSSIGAGKSGDICILGYPSLIKIEDRICVKNLAGSTLIKAELK